MTKLGKRLIEAMEEVHLIMTGETSAEGIKVHPSCGCVFCDIGLKPTKLRRQYVHHIKREGRFVICKVNGIKPTMDLER